MANLVEITKSNVGLVGGLWKSKKFCLAALWTTASFSAPDVVPIWLGAAVAATYILGQSFVEGMAARTAGKIAVEPEDLVAPAEEKKP